MIGFIAGAIAGGVAMWLWGEDLRRVSGRDMRTRAADTLRSVESKAGEVLDTAKGRVQSTLKAGEDALRRKAD